MIKTFKINLDDIILEDSNFDEETLSKMMQSLGPVYAYSAETPRDVPPTYIDKLNSILNEKNYFNKLNKSKKIELISATSFILSRLLISNQYKYIEHQYGEHQTLRRLLEGNQLERRVIGRVSRFRRQHSPEQRVLARFVGVIITLAEGGAKHWQGARGQDRRCLRCWNDSDATG